jgi:hypothetical protein
MESLLLGLEEELRAAAQAAVQSVVARTREEQRVLQAERDAGVKYKQLTAAVWCSI